MHTTMLRSSWILRVLLFAVVGSFGCADAPVPPAPTASCTGPRCSCGTGNVCRCTMDGDCNVACGLTGCSLSCDATAKCNASGDGPVDITCTAAADCKGHGGDGSDITCSDTSHCDLKAGDDSTASCEDTAVCKINIGLRGNVQCLGAADCDIKCDGACVVTCMTTGRCAVNCGADDAGIAAETCADGRVVCGGC